MHGDDGLDELSTAASSRVVEWDAERGLRPPVDPADLGLPPASPEQLKGGDPAHNAQAARAVLSGQKGAQRDIVLLNAAAALVVVGDAADLVDGLYQASASIDSGRAAACLERLVGLSQAEAAAHKL